MEIKAIKVTQPLGDFFITKIKASDLLMISTSQIARYDENGKLQGNQRKLDTKRISLISNYIKSKEMCFPTSIIVAANVNEKGIILDEEDENRWKINEEDDDFCKITIPNKQEKTCVIIDGQHRLNAFDMLDDDYKNIELVCSVFFNLPNPYQAFLFATINGNQKPVSKSLSLDLYGYNLEHESQNKWNPEKLAVSLARKLNFNQDSPLFNSIKLAPNTDALSLQKDKLLVSMYAVVSGILKLIAKNPQKDRDFMAMKKNKLFGDDSRKALKDDGAVLRDQFLNCKDEEIYSILYDYFTTVKNLIWDNQPSDSVLKKTIGILVLFDILKLLLEKNRRNFKVEIKKITELDYCDKLFSLSGGGRSSLYRILRFILDLGTSKEELKPTEIDYLKEYGLDKKEP